MSSISPSLSRSSSRENIQHPPQTKETPTGVSLPPLPVNTKKKNEDTVIKMPKIARRKYSGEERSSSSSSSTGAAVAKITKKVVNKKTENPNNSREADAPDELSGTEHPENISAPEDSNFREFCTYPMDLARENKSITASFLCALGSVGAFAGCYTQLWDKNVRTNIDTLGTIMQEGFEHCIRAAYYGNKDFFATHNLSTDDLRQCVIGYLQQKTSTLLEGYNFAEIVPPDRPLPLSVGQIPADWRAPVLSDICRTVVDGTFKYVSEICRRFDHKDDLCKPGSCGYYEQYSAPFPPEQSSDPNRIVVYCMSAVLALSGLLCIVALFVRIFKAYQQKD